MEADYLDPGPPHVTVGVGSLPEFLRERVKEGCNRVTVSFDEMRLLGYREDLIAEMEEGA